MAQPPEFVQPLGSIANYQKASSYAKELHSSVVLSEPDRVDATVLAMAEVTAIKIASLTPVAGIPNNDQANMQSVLDSIGELRTTIANMNVQMNVQMTNMNVQMANMSARITDMDARIANMDARITNMDARMTNMDARITNMDDRINTIDATLEDIKGLCHKNQAMAVRALNATRSNGMNYQYDQVPFPDGRMPTSVEMPVHGQVKFPHIKTVGDLVKLPVGTVNHYLEAYGIERVGDEAQRRWALGKCVGIHEKHLVIATLRAV
ncbi:hypothetical protein EYR40_001580 [Pleurotus pulmonarius]|nr:hypothetical protein EYR36_000066 [Pleurotus pulmonarius]KAF4604401.1 hypothetical protein EYR38_004823 [Pleurotus pulmonarius]KAF4609227.1 hypothetical protein EYR40_001580 [Pleurotus pulmonarius]